MQQQNEYRFNNRLNFGAQIQIKQTKSCQKWKGARDYPPKFICKVKSSDAKQGFVVILKNDKKDCPLISVCSCVLLQAGNV